MGSLWHWSLSLPKGLTSDAVFCLLMVWAQKSNGRAMKQEEFDVADI